MHDRNALEDFSDSNSSTDAAADDPAQHQRRLSEGNAGAVSRSSRGPLLYERGA